ncbi:hypothetical protein M9458_033664, partial [Cirrhinus mrigala]
RLIVVVACKFTRLWKSTVVNELSPESKRFLPRSLTGANELLARVLQTGRRAFRSVVSGGF